MMRLIGAATGSGGRDQEGNALAPAYAMPRLAALLTPTIPTHVGLTHQEPALGNASDVTGTPLSRLRALCEALAGDVCQATLARLDKRRCSAAFPVVIGGDHSCAVGTWSGVSKALRSLHTLEGSHDIDGALSTASFGLLWIDAHMDSHTPATSASGNIHGMPLAALLGEGHSAMTAVAGAKPKLLPQHVALFGIRSYEPDEAALLARLGVRVFTMQEIAERGVALCFSEALAIVNSAPAGFGLTFDLDALDPLDAPATCCPEPGGLRAKDMLQALKTLPYERLLAAEFVELNPALAGADVTVGLMSELIGSLLPAKD